MSGAPLSIRAGKNPPRAAAVVELSLCDSAQRGSDGSGKVCVAAAQSD